MDLPQPDLNGLRHSAAPGSLAGVWLASLFGDSPKEGVFAALHSPDVPAWSPSAREPERVDTQPVACDWGDLRLFVWRDQSVVLASPSLQGGWDVWPATFSLLSDVFVGQATAVPFLQRPLLFPKIVLRTHAAGVGMEHLSIPDKMDAAYRRAITPEAIGAWLEACARERLAEVRAAAPLSDPRAQPWPLPGSRFAPFSPFPGPTEAEHLLATRLLEALADILHLPSLQVMRREAPSPWKDPQSGPLVLLPLSSTHKAWNKWIRSLFHGPDAFLPPSAVLMGARPQDHKTTVLAATDPARGPARSAHQRLAAYDALLRAPFTPEMLAAAPAPVQAWLAHHRAAASATPQGV